VIKAKVIESSFNDENILTTVLVTYPRIVHAEMLRHRMFSSSVSSSRAKPFSRFVEEEVAMPVLWQLNKPGMQGGDIHPDVERCMDEWDKAAQSAFMRGMALERLGLHKQIVNRVVEPFTHVDHLISATEWDNFFNLRMHPDADPTIQAVATAIHDVMVDDYLDELAEKEWHLPFVTKKEREDHAYETLCMVSAARCARVSYSNHDGTNPSIARDVALAKKLIDSKHWSPFEHQATYAQHVNDFTHYMKDGSVWSNNFRGIIQYRSLIDNVD